MSPQAPSTATLEQPLAPDRLAEIIAGYALDKKAHDVVTLDLRALSGFTDAFVICSGGTDRQAKAIHDAIHLGLKQDHGLLPQRVEGLTESRWILMDYLDVVVHIFTPETREYYRLEALWGDVPRTHHESGPDDTVEAVDVLPGA